MYRTICTQLWTDKKVQRLTVPGKLLFVYLITNPHTHLSGIYYLPQELIRKETGLSDTLCHTLLDTLSEIERAHYDEETSTVFVVNMFEYQGKGPKNEKSAAKQLETLHHTRLIPLFIKRYPSVEQFCADTLLIPYRYPIPSCPSAPNPVLLISSSESRGEKIVKKRGNGAHPIPEDWSPKESHVKLASARKLDLPIEAAHFRGKAMELEWVTKNWDQKFTNWMLQEIKFRQRRAT